ncbi:MAG: arylsulfatase B [Paraglaciecola chathamensis]
MKKTHYLIGICCAFLLQACQGSGSSSVVTKQENNQATGAPNILFILLDDLGYGDVGYLGSQIQTPNIDNLASQGVTLKHGYAYPICSPTRAALMTGKNPLNFGIDGPMENDAMLPEDLTTMPERFQEAGYQTWMVGKWHLGMAKRSAMPHNRGFDDFYGFLGGFVDYYTHVYFGGLDWQNNDTSLREEGFVTELLTAKAIDKITHFKGDKPFFMYLSYSAPHTPLQYVPNAINDYSGFESKDRQVFADMTSDVDQDIGEVLAALDKRGIAENTIVVFMSDNGGNLEAGANNGSLQGGKSSVYEGGVRVPVLIRWPAQLQSKTMTQPMFTQDWAPTLLEAANIDYQPNDFDGVSQFVNLKEEQEKTFKREVVVGTAKQKAVYQWPWKLIVDAKGNKHLFNLSQDEFEHSDVAMEHPELVAQLMSELTLLPHLPSKAAKGPPPESLFLDAHGLFDYNVRKAETRKPWLETAL